MEILELEKIKNDAHIKSLAIARLLEERESTVKAISDLKYLQRHAGEMIFTGNSGRINDRDVLLKTVKINTLAGCIKVPELLIELAESKLLDLEAQSKEFLTPLTGQ